MKQQPPLPSCEGGGITKSIGGRRSSCILNESLKDQWQIGNPDVAGSLKAQHVFPQIIPRRKQVERPRAVCQVNTLWGILLGRLLLK